MLHQASILEYYSMVQYLKLVAFRQCTRSEAAIFAKKASQTKEHLDIVTSHRSTLTEAEYAFLARQRIARLATADANGHPTAVPVCFACDRERIYIALDEKPKSVSPYQLKRVRNIQARHEASLLLDHYSEDWSQLAYLVISGPAELIEPAHPLHAPALALLRVRYEQYHAMKLEELPMIVITIEKVSSWGRL